MALTYTPAGELGSSPSDFALPGVDGKTWRLSDFSHDRALVVAFICNHCPYVIAVQSRINELAREYRSRGVGFIAINSNDATKYPDDGFEEMKAEAARLGYVFPYVFDESQAVARKYGAVCTPDFFVYANDVNEFSLVYRGRLDDSWKDAAQVKRRDLAAALDAVLDRREPLPEQVPSMGCSIKWK